MAKVSKRLGSEIESNLGLWAASPDTVPHPLTPHPQGSLTELGTGPRGKGISELLTFSPGLSPALASDIGPAEAGMYLGRERHLVPLF